MTKGEAVKERYSNFNGEIDYALPQKWVEFVVNALHCEYWEIVSQFVWGYENGSPSFGKPMPLTEQADDLIRRAPFLFR